MSAKLTGGSIKASVQASYSKASQSNESKVADYIPTLAKVDPKLFGISIVTTDGHIINVGDAKSPFAIESIAKVFTLALAMKDHNAQGLFDKIGTNPTGLPFNSVQAIEPKPYSKSGYEPLS